MKKTTIGTLALALALADIAALKHYEHTTLAVPFAALALAALALAAAALAHHAPRP